MTPEDKTLTGSGWSDERASLDLLRLENWLTIARVVRWSPLVFAPLKIRVALGLVSGGVCAAWLYIGRFGAWSCIIGLALSLVIVSLLSVCKRVLLRWSEKRMVEIGGTFTGAITASEALAFAGDAFAYGKRRGTIPAAATLANFRRKFPRPRASGSRSSPWWLAAGVQLLYLSSFGIGGVLLSVIGNTAPLPPANRLVQAFSKEGGTAFDTPLKEMPMEAMPSSTVAPAGAREDRDPGQRPRPEIPEEIEIDIKQRSRKLVQLENEGDLAPLLALYGQSVNYFGTKTDAIKLRREKEADFKKWVKRKYQVTSEPKITPIGENKWRVVFDQTFECENLAGDRTTGKVASALVFEFINGELRIIEQSGPVSDYQKIARAQPVPTPPAEPLDAVGEGPRRPDPMDHPVPSSPEVMYKVPDLSRLVNTRLDNKWLYGQFCIFGLRGNVADCRTFGRGILLGAPGQTRVEIEFAGGIQLDAEVLRMIHNGAQPVLTISSTRPMQLLAVTSRAEGYIQARARAQGALTRRDLSY
ncbi:MAG TPA: hypothetical protein VM940_09135 [Chthoniobacterales bacterium]|jgi:hypothetical protein|nr:hypothetical protein [Chthoniobacterales bacterium]